MKAIGQKLDNGTQKLEKRKLEVSYEKAAAYALDKTSQDLTTRAIEESKNQRNRLRHEKKMIRFQSWAEESLKNAIFAGLKQLHFDEDDLWESMRI